MRGFAAYLALADRVYGRLTEAGLRSYAHSPNKQLRIAEIRHGSLEIIFQEAIAHYKDATPFAIVYLFFKYFGSTAKSVAEAYKTIEEAKLANETRKHLKEEMKQDKALAKLEPARINQLIKLLEDLQAKEAERIVPASRFAEEEVKDVQLIVVKRDT